jgi:NadR type nicotinamide-nucleotide adenylyltransferase
MENAVKKIVIVGPESTGKSTLCTQLAAHYETLWCPEYAREYLLQNGTTYTFDNLDTIAKGQLELEEKYTEEVKSKKAEVNNGSSDVDLSSKISRLFIDTDMYVMKVWCEFVFGDCHKWILNKIVERKYDLYLLCQPDLPWVKDELREYPDLESREKLYHIYKDLLINQSVPWVEISGNYEERLQKAILAVENV